MAKTGIILFLALCFSVVYCGHAQNEVEAFRYSTFEAGMSARSMGMNGAFSSVGADLSSYYLNPAGIALYKRSSFEGALEQSIQNTQSTYEGVSNEQVKTRFSLNNIGFTATRTPRSGRVKNINFGVAYARTNNFYQDLTIEGRTPSSLMQQFALQAQGISPDQLYNTLSFTAGPAYDVYGIDPADPAGNFYVPATVGEANQRKRIVREGRQNETSLALAANISDDLYLGGSIQIGGIYFSELADYSETYEGEARVKSIAFDEDLVTTGTVLAAQLGAIYKVNDYVRLGASYRTKSLIFLQDIYSTAASSEVAQNSYFSESPELLSDYILTTPSRWTFGAAGIIGKYGIISLDAETSDYSSIRMEGSEANVYDYSAENELYSEIFRQTLAVRAGIEARILATYYVRLGYGIQQHPFSEDAGALNDAMRSWSFGAGYRGDHFFADLGVRNLSMQNSYYLYDPNLVRSATLHESITRLMLSAGFRF